MGGRKLTLTQASTLVHGGAETQRRWNKSDHDEEEEEEMVEADEPKETKFKMC